MNSPSCSLIPPQITDLLRSGENLVVTTRHGSILHQQVFEEIVTSTWNLGNDLFVVCSEAVFEHISTVLQKIVIRTDSPVDLQVYVQPGFEMLADLDSDKPSLVLIT